MTAEAPFAALFDHDGTLVDSETLHYEFWAEVGARHGFSIDRDEYERELVGVPSSENAVYIVKSRGLDLDPAFLHAEKERAAKVYLEKNAFPILPGAREALSFFRERGAKIAIVTSASRPTVEPTIRAYGFGPLLDTVVSAEDVTNGKPDPEPYLLAMKRLGVAAERCVAFEDSLNGSKSAAASGAITIAIPQPPFDHAHFGHAAFVARDMEEARAWAAEKLGLG